MLKVPTSLWHERVSNLMERRKSIRDDHHLESHIADYKCHISKISIGKTVLDVGCGSMEIKKHLSNDIAYLGIDAFPVSDEVVKMKIEDCYFKDNAFETVFCFAVLDGVEDLSLALHHIKRICSKNILILTGIGIEPDKYHTIKISEEYLIREMNGWKIGYRKYLQEKVLLIEFRK